MSIQLLKANLVVNGDFCAGGEIFDQFERSSPLCLGLVFFTGRLRPKFIFIDDCILGMAIAKLAKGAITAINLQYRILQFVLCFIH